MRHALSFLARAAALATSLVLPGQAAAGAPTPPDLSLEDLLQADVVTASRRAQAVQDVAAAAFVITREDIERSGATSLPEALRLVPGVQVARLASGRWAVSVRGFNSRFANKLLVLIDGRSVYSPLFSGVLWEMEGTLLEDIARIEVIRGPGAALWGANAVNGVINIITRKARETQGVLLATGAGNVERGSVAARWGAELPGGQYRVWAKTESHRAFDDAAGNPGNDAWRSARLGFRADTELHSGDALTLSGSVASSRAGDRWYEASLLSPVGVTVRELTQRTEAAHLLARYSRLAADGSETVLQGYVSEGRVRVSDRVGEQRTTVEVDVQHRPRLDGRHDLVWGATARVSDDTLTGGGGFIAFPREQRRFTLASVFVNDEITLQPERLRATLGARLEHNNFTGLEPQAHARLAWTPSRTQTLWTSLSRAVRTPSRAEIDAQVDLAVTPADPPRPPVLLRSVAVTDGELKSETVTALEIGYRHQIDARLAVDLALFHNRYAGLIGGVLGAQGFESQPVPHAVQTIERANNVEGRTQGFELALDWRASRDWRIQASYSALQARITPTSPDPIALGASVSRANSAPRQQWSLRSSWSLGPAGELDARLRHVSKVQEGEAAAPAVPAYTALDLRYEIRPRPGLSLALSGENLLERRHAEFTPDLLPSQALQVPRSIRFKAQWQF